MSEPLRIFVGWDDRESLAYHVLAHSIIRRASGPVSIAPVHLRHLADVHTRERDPLASTDFSISRFLVPYLCGFEGQAIFLDCDMIVLDDIYKVLAETRTGKAVYVCQHDYTPKTDKKFLGQKQSKYPRKNWASFIVFNCAKCWPLHPEYVEAASGSELHRFKWISDGQIGSLPLEWNWLVGEYDPNPRAKILHYTLGGPWFKGYENCDHADLWHEECASMINANAHVSSPV